MTLLILPQQHVARREEKTNESVRDVPVDKQDVMNCDKFRGFRLRVVSFCSYTLPEETESRLAAM